MAKVTFLPPTVGAVAGSIPVLLAGGFIKLLSSSTMLQGTPTNWGDLGTTLTTTQIIADTWGWVGLMFTILAIILMIYGSTSMILKPSSDE